MSSELLKVEKLFATVEGTQILNGLDLTVGEGETHVIMGPNGAGKSTLGNVIMGNPVYSVDSGHIYFDGQDITALKTDERARLGIFISFQSPQEVPGITLEQFMRASRSAVTGKPLKVFAFQKEMKGVMETLSMDHSYAGRDLNVGFSGGEKKKAEILQMLMMNPRLAILDETDSGLDVDAVKVVSEGIRQFKKEGNSLIIITHNARILEGLKVDYTHVLSKGRIIKSGDSSLVDEIERDGFKGIDGAEQE
ncbi:MAG: Fe-S cluster assembly ATPase SufC [Lachnospiraceae bacterium]|nr:Fe-S cluster assembly ATPase SufC [Lachnospiraceae bacterium]